jgi:conjugative relaxase-like TrwC/TraI family protein
MLSITDIKDAAAAKHYYEKDNYYVKDSEVARDNSRWHGRGAELLGLSGEVQLDRFEELLGGQIDADTRLGREEAGEWKHKAAWDLTFSAPKSVSILTEIEGHEALRQAHEKAVSAALDYIERRAATTRLTREGLTELSQTGNLTVARFTHNTSRELDPQLHTHTVVLNATQTENGWRSLESKSLYDIKMAAGLAYRNELAKQAKELGYSIRVTREKDGLFEIDGIPDEVLRHFSQRRAQIEAQLKALGLSESSKAAEVATLDSRQRKHDVDHQVLHNAWQERLQAVHGELLQQPAPSRNRPAKEFADASEYVRYVTEKLSERDARFARDRFQGQVALSQFGAFSIDDIEHAVDQAIQSNELIPRGRHGQYLTTKAAIKRERQTLSYLMAGLDSVKPIADQALIDQRLAKYERSIQRDFFPGQKQAIQLMLTTEDRFVGVQGYAGTGKTTMLSAAGRIAEQQGVKVKGFAPSAAAAKVLANETGFDSQTVDQLLVDIRQVTAKGGKQDRSGELWVIDEAGMLSTRQTNGIMAAAHDTGARVVFLGDVQQLEAVEAGRPFAQLQDAEMKTAIMKDIVRQRDENLLEAVKGTIERDIDKALQKLEGNVVTHVEREDRLSALINEYFDLTPEERTGTLVLTPANEDRDAVNQAIRARLKQDGVIHGPGYSTYSLENNDLTRVEHSKAFNYNEGDIVRFGRGYKSLDIQKDEYFVVTGRDVQANTVELKSMLSGKEVKTWNPEKIAAKSVETYHLQKRELAVGDSIRWRRNDKEAGLINSEKMTITKLQGRMVTAVSETGQSITFDADHMRYKHYDYSYADTAYTAQGQTKDRVLALAESYRKNLIHHKSFYVSISRARDKVRVFTEDEQKLAKALKERSGENTVAIDAKQYGRENFPKKGKGLGFMFGL